jgi:hypothetical protein
MNVHCIVEQLTQGVKRGFPRAHAHCAFRTNVVMDQVQTQVQQQAAIGVVTITPIARRILRAMSGTIETAIAEEVAIEIAVVSVTEIATETEIMTKVDVSIAEARVQRAQRRGLPLRFLPQLHHKLRCSRSRKDNNPCSFPD